MLMRRLDPQVVGTRREDGAGGFRGGTKVAQLALAELIGDQAWREAVRDYIAGDDAAEMICSVLRLVRPLAAAQECLRLWREGTGSERGCAIELLRVTAYPQALALVPEFLADPDEAVQGWGASVVDQLVWDEVAEPEQAEHCLQLMESHPAQHIRELAADVRHYVAERERSKGTPQQP
jgi:hypothetical protein